MDIWSYETSRRIWDKMTFHPGDDIYPTTVGSPAPVTYRQQYVVYADGNSFVMNAVVGDATASPITVILNWTPQSGVASR